MTPSTAPCHPGGFSHSVAITGTAVATDQLQVFINRPGSLIHLFGNLPSFQSLVNSSDPNVMQALLSLPDISVSVDASAITVNCSKAQLSKVFQD